MGKKVPFRTLLTRRTFGVRSRRRETPSRALRPEPRRPQNMTRMLRHLALAGATLLVLALAMSANAFAAADPDHVSFTHEGCRLVTTTELPGPDGFVCTDAEYTPGNLGKNWNELDNVPHRLTADNGGPDQTYAIAITADNQKAGAPGYDVISIPVLN